MPHNERLRTYKPGVNDACQRPQSGHGERRLSGAVAVRSRVVQVAPSQQNNASLVKGVRDLEKRGACRVEGGGLLSCGVGGIVHYDTAYCVPTPLYDMRLVSFTPRGKKGRVYR